MWEDNNPLSYDRRSSTSSFHRPGLSPAASDDSHGADPPDFLTYQAPSEHSQDDFPPRNNLEDDDDDEGEEEEYRQQRKPTGYGSRVEQMLMENKDVAIKIADAGKNSEGSGGYIVYTIRTGVCFDSFQNSIPHQDISFQKRHDRHMGVIEIFKLTNTTGPGSSSSLLRIRISSQESRPATSLSYRTPHTRETSSLRLCSRTHER